jgi:hypothetical protein
MKKFRLFVAAALAAMCGQQAMALDIDEPVLDGSKLTPLVIEDVADVDTVYLYHVGQNMFLTEGNAYGTQTSLGNAGNKIVIQREGVDGYKLYNYSPGKAGWKYIFVADANGSYVDMASQGHNVFTFYKLDNGNYEFSILRTDATYGVESSFGETRFGWDGVEGSTIIMPLLDLASADAEFFQYEWKIVSVKDAALAVYQAKTDLFNALNKAVDQGVADDKLSNYAALLTSSDASAETILAAVQAVEKLINEQIFSGDLPIDVTALVENASCTEGGLQGWNINNTSTFQYNTWSTEADESGMVTPFIENWVAKPGPLGDAVISHDPVKNLKKGWYTVEAFVRVYSESGSEPEGAFMFANDKELDLAAKGNHFTYNGMLGIYRNKYKIDVFVGDDGELQFGFKIKNATFNWIAFKDITLTFIGELNVKTQIEAALTDAMEYITKDVYEGYLEQLEELMSEAEEMLDGDPTEAEANDMVTRLETCMAAISKNEKLYDEFAQAIDRLYDAIINFDVTQYDKADALEELSQKGMTGQGLQDELDNHELNNEQLEEAIKKIDDTILEVKYSGIKPGREITDIIDDPVNTEKPTTKGWTIEGAITDASNYSIELYERDFNMYQEYKNVPAGKYTLKLQVYERPGTNETAYANYKAGNGATKSEIYVNDVITPTPNIYSETSDTDLNADSIAAGYFASYGPESWLSPDGTYFANGMSGARAWFHSINPATGKNYYETEVTGLVADEDGNGFGTLRYGFRNTNHTSYQWIIFSNFRLFYDGMGWDVIQPIYEQTIAQAEGLYETPMCADSLNALKASVTALQALQGQEGNEIMAAIANVNKAYSAAKTSIGYYDVLVQRLAWSKEYADSLGGETGKAEYDAAFNAVNQKMLAGIYSDEEVGGEPVAEVTRFTNTYLVAEPCLAATAEDPADISFVIVNGDCSSLSGWTAFKAEDKANGWQNQNNGPYDVYDAEGNIIMDQPQIGGGDNFIEMWIANTNQLPDARLSQKILGTLPTGLYRLTAVCQGALQGSDANQTGCYLKLETPSNTANAVEVATLENKPQLYSILAVVEEGDVEDLTIAFELNKTTCNWVFIDNIKLEYLGKEIPEGITAAENAGVKTTTIYNLNGAQTNILHKGVNIVKMQMSDGTTKVQKVIVK